MNNVDPPLTTNIVDHDTLDHGKANTHEVFVDAAHPSGGVVPARRGPKRLPPGFAKLLEYKKDAGFDDQRFKIALNAHLSNTIVYELFDIQVAAPLVGKTLHWLKAFLPKHPKRFPPRYRKYQVGYGRTRCTRVLTAREILEIRTESLFGPGRFTQ